MGVWIKDEGTELKRDSPDIRTERETDKTKQEKTSYSNGNTKEKQRGQERQQDRSAKKASQDGGGG